MGVIKKEKEKEKGVIFLLIKRYNQLIILIISIVISYKYLHITLINTI
jgi:hypothetical protein